VKSQGQGIHQQHMAWVMAPVISEKKTHSGAWTLANLSALVPRPVLLCAKGRATQLSFATFMTAMAAEWLQDSIFLHGRKHGEKAAFPMKTA